MSDIGSSPAVGASPKQDLPYYKAQYEQLELELHEFQASSRELEAELEKDIEASEKRERQLREKVEGLGYEVDEWKVSQTCDCNGEPHVSRAGRNTDIVATQTKYKQSKAEASNAQNTLQKEITTLRDTSRTLQLKLRDIEVANDDYERQARNTTSSLENLESKFNQAIERAVMLEEEIKIGEQEREGLRIETQRLRDELSDLKIEAEIVQEKLRNAEATIEAQRNLKPHHLVMDSLRAPSPASEASTSATTLSSPTASTPPPKSSVPSIVSESQTPPSPPLSDKSTRVKNNPQVTPTPIRKRPPTTRETLATPRPSQGTLRSSRHSRGASVAQSQTSTTSRATSSVTQRSRQSTTSRPSGGNVTREPTGAARSSSLYHIRGLTAKIQKLEERVHNARSKLPAPVNTPPRASPRGGSAMGNHIPSSVTVRSNKKRSSGSTASSITGTNESRKSISRLSFGGPSDRVVSGNGPPNTAGVAGGSRPSSRASVTSLSATNSLPRPPSRSSLSGARTPMGYSSNTAKISYAEGIRRPRSSMSGTWGHSSYGHGHSHSVSVSNIFENEPSTPGSTTPSVRRSITLRDVSGIPTPSMLPRRQSGSLSGRRQSLGYSGSAEAPPVTGEMGPPAERRLTRKLSEVGETY